MSRWFFVQKGQAKGPLTTQEVEQKIHSGHVGPLDLFYLDGEEKWRPLAEFEHFQKSLKSIKKVRTNDLWVLLVKQGAEPAQKNYVQKGPFNSESVLSMIHSGEIRYADFAWKSGMKQWYRISSLEVFNEAAHSPGKVKLQKAPKNLAPPPLPEDFTQSVLLESIVTQPKKEAKIEPKKPEEAEGPDLVEEKAGSKKKAAKGRAKEKKRLKKKSPPPAKTKKREPKKKSSRKRSSRPRDPLKEQFVALLHEWQRPWMLHFVFFVGLVLLVGLGALVFSYVDRIRKQAADAPVKVEQVTAPAKAQKRRSKRPQKTKGKSQKVAAKKKPKPRVKKVPTKKAPGFLRVSVSGASGKSGKLVIKTDASSHYRVKYSVIGESGRILGRKSYYRTWYRKGRSGDPINVSLASVGLNPDRHGGEYLLLAEINGIRKTKKFFVGKNNYSFKQSLKSQKKSLSYWHQIDRRDLVRTFDRLKYLASDLRRQGARYAKDSKKWQSFYNRWKARYKNTQVWQLNKAKERNSNALIHASQWVALKELRSELRKQSIEINKAVWGKKPVNTTRVAGIAKELSKAHSNSLTLSLWR